MKKYGIIGIVFVGVAVICAFTFRGHKEADYLLTDFPAEADPVTVGNKIADRFLEQWHSQYGSPLRVDEPRTQITYPDVCTWLGGLWFAQATKNRGLEERLEARFQPLFTTEAYLQPQANHVDNNVFGAVPLELYMQTKDEKYLAMGMKYADTQWDAPATQKLTEEEMRFLQAVDPQLYMQAARIQAMRDSLEQQLEHCKSKEEAAKVFSDTMSMVSDKDPMKEYIVAAYQDAYNEFQKSGKYQHLPQKSSDDNKSDSLVALDKTTDFLTDSTDHRSERKSHQDRYDSDLATE